jgi:hypothetical protein
MGRQISKGVQPTIILGLPGVEVNSSVAVNSNRIYYVNTSSAAITLTLPTTPSQGDVIQIIDVKGTFDTNNLTLNPGGAGKIMRQTTGDTMVISVSGAAFSLVYYDATSGWLLENI